MTRLYIGNSQGLERTLVSDPGVKRLLFRMAAPSSLSGALLLLLATIRCLGAIFRTRPNVTFSTGGYVSIPAVLASWILRIPIVMFLPDVVPGKAVSWLLPLCKYISVSTGDAAARLPTAKVRVTGYPVRSVFRSVTREQARVRFGIPADAFVLCVFGGSRGARALNQAVAANLPEILDRCHVLHICGDERLPEAQSAAPNLNGTLRDRYQLFPYLHDDDMAAALVAADLALCRSGASTIGELPAAGVPAILVPLPEAKVHQRENADFLMRHGAAVIVDNNSLARDLLSTVQGLIGDPERLEQMRQAARSLDRPDAASAIAAVVMQAATE